jgi:hypothetical protein
MRAEPFTIEETAEYTRAVFGGTRGGRPAASHRLKAARRSPIPRPSRRSSPTFISSGWRTKANSFEPGEVATSFITRYFDSSCSSRNEQHGEGHRASNHKSYSNITKKVPGRRPALADPQGGLLTLDPFPFYPFSSHLPFSDSTPFIHTNSANRSEASRMHFNETEVIDSNELAKRLNVPAT